MTWINRGLIFDCSKHTIDGNEILYSQAPQATALEDRIRVFFCTRVRDTEFTWISQPAFVDYSLDMNFIIDGPKLVKLTPPILGSFDEHGIFPFHPYQDQGDFWGFSTGWSRRQSVDVETSIGLLKSLDFGESFERIGHGPILTASLNEPFLVCDAWVLRFKSEWQMWYLFGTNWDDTDPEESPQRIYKIGKATSPDGLNWTNSGGKSIIKDVLGPNEAQALPSVRNTEEGLEMVFCYRPHKGFRQRGNLSYQLGYASSQDGEIWTRDDQKIRFPKLLFDSDMRCYPSFFSNGTNLYLLFNGNEFGRNGFGLAEWTN